jgi:hypothetical protein
MDRNGNVYAIANCSSTGATGPFVIAYCSPQNTDWSAWGPPVQVTSLNPGLATDTIDGQIIDIRDGNYTWLYKDRVNGNAAGRANQIANTPVANGPFSSLANVETGQSWGPYWANGDNYESVCSVLLSTGHNQVYADNYSTPSTGEGYSSNTGSTLTANWSSVNALSVNGLRAATMHVDLWPGFASFVAVTPTTATVTASDAQGGLWSGGTYQWIQSTNGGTTWSNCTGTNVTTLSATITGLSLSTPTLIQLQYIDSSSNSVYSNLLSWPLPNLLTPTYPIHRARLSGPLISRIYG